MKKKSTATKRAAKPAARAKQPLSLLAYGKRRGVSAEAVRRAIQSGRLGRSIVMVGGKPKIADPELADREWESNTRTSRPPEASAAGPNDEAGPGSGAGDDGITYAEARRRREVELWLQSRIKREADELDLRVKKGELIPVDAARAEVIESYTIVKTRLLGVPTRCGQRITSLSPGDVRVIEDLVREALEELADAE